MIGRCLLFVSRSQAASVLPKCYMGTAPFKVGDSACLIKAFSRDDVLTFADVTFDTNPIHTDEEMAKKSRFGQCIVHGVLTVGLLSGVMGTKLPGPGAIVLSYDIVHPEALLIDELVKAEVIVKEIKGRQMTLALRCTAQGSRVVTTGVAKLLVGKDQVGPPKFG